MPKITMGGESDPNWYEVTMRDGTTVSFHAGELMASMACSEAVRAPGAEGVQATAQIARDLFTPKEAALAASDAALFSVVTSVMQRIQASGNG